VAIAPKLPGVPPEPGFGGFGDFVGEPASPGDILAGIEECEKVWFDAVSLFMSQTTACIEACDISAEECESCLAGNVGMGTIECAGLAEDVLQRIRNNVSERVHQIIRSGDRFLSILPIPDSTLIGTPPGEQGAPADTPASPLFPPTELRIPESETQPAPPSSPVQPGPSPAPPPSPTPQPSPPPPPPESPPAGQPSPNVPPATISPAPPATISPAPPTGSPSPPAESVLMPPAGQPGLAPPLGSLPEFPEPPDTIGLPKKREFNTPVADKRFPISDSIIREGIKRIREERNKPLTPPIAVDVNIPCENFNVFAWLENCPSTVIDSAARLFGQIGQEILTWDSLDDVIKSKDRVVKSVFRVFK